MPTADSLERMALAKKAAADAAAKKKANAAAAAKAKQNAAAAKKQQDAAAKAKADKAIKDAAKKAKAKADKEAMEALRMKLGGGITASNEATSLYVDPTPAYQPALNYLATQTKAANDRYLVNKQNITNIFGDLAGLAEKDSVRIRDQFTASIANQQMGLANRTAEVRQATAAGEAQATATGAERGQGPAMVNNPVAVAAEQGIARSNEYQTTWQALQEANQQQAQTDISARGAGYGQQQVGAIQQLAQNLEDKLIQLAGNTAQVQSDIAAAKIAGQQTVAQANYGEIQTAKEQQAKLALEQVKANAKIASANANANKPKTEKPKTYDKTLSGWTAYINDNASSPADATKFLDSIYKAEAYAVSQGQTSGSAYQTWASNNKDFPAAYKTKAKEYFNYYYKK